MMQSDDSVRPRPSVFACTTHKISQVSNIFIGNEVLIHLSKTLCRLQKIRELILKKCFTLYFCLLIIFIYILVPTYELFGKINNFEY